MTTNAPALGGSHASETPLTRTAEEILAYVKADHGLFDFRSQVVIDALSYALAEEYLTDEYKAKVAAGEETWKQVATKEAVIAQMGEYMDFAWGKVEDHRGLSANRSVSKMRGWLWLLDDEDLIATVAYPQYGAPILAAVCAKYGFPIPESEDLALMIKGKPCTQGGGCGCGS